MKIVPYEKNRGNSCALSCYTMVARYLWPEKGITFEQLAKIADYHVGYVAWGFSVWLWMIEQGAKIIDYDVVDYEAWAKCGLDGYKNSVSVEHYNDVVSKTFDINKDTEDLKKLFGNPNFTFVKKIVDWNDVLHEFEKPGLCDLTMDANIIDPGRNQDGMALHRVILLDITDDEVVFHDPNIDGTGANRREPLELFKKAFLAVPDGSEICRYSLSKNE